MRDPNKWGYWWQGVVTLACLSSSCSSPVSGSGHLVLVIGRRSIRCRSGRPGHVPASMSLIVYVDRSRILQDLASQSTTLAGSPWCPQPGSRRRSRVRARRAHRVGQLRHRTLSVGHQIGPISARRPESGGSPKRVMSRIGWSCRIENQTGGSRQPQGRPDVRIGRKAEWSRCI